LIFVLRVDARVVLPRIDSKPIVYLLAAPPPLSPIEAVQALLKERLPVLGPAVQPEGLVVATDNDGFKMAVLVPREWNLSRT
jgi:hypothetical protein